MVCGLLSHPAGLAERGRLNLRLISGASLRDAPATGGMILRVSPGAIVARSLRDLPGGDLAADDADTGDVAYLPRGDRVRLTAVKAGCLVEALRTLRTDAAGLEGIELGLTFVATPDRADGRRSSATGARESLSARDLFKLAQCSGSFEAVPAIEAGVGGDEASPDGAREIGEDDEPGDSEEAQE